jgi:hypothetical protein
MPNFDKLNLKIGLDQLKKSSKELDAAGSAKGIGKPRSLRVLSSSQVSDESGSATGGYDRKTEDMTDGLFHSDKKAALDKMGGTIKTATEETLSDIEKIKNIQSELSSKASDKFGSATGGYNRKAENTITEMLNSGKKTALDKIENKIKTSLEPFSGIEIMKDLLPEATGFWGCDERENSIHNLIEMQESSLQNARFAERWQAMGLQPDSKEYKEFLRMLEGGGKVKRDLYHVFYQGDVFRRLILARAINNGEINFYFETVRGEKFLMNTVMVHNQSSDSGFAVHKENDDKRREIIESHLYEPYIYRGTDFRLFLDAESFLSWLKKEYPYEGAEQVKEEEPKENDSAPSLSPKRESNLLKIIGGFVQIVYLQKDTGKFWKGEKREQPNISAIAEAFQDQLTKAGYSDDGFKDRHLRNIISEALEQIQNNKKS